METVQAAWAAATATSAVPGPWVALLSAAVVAIAVFWRRTWPVTRHLVTIAHEGGHAVVAVAMRRRLSGIRLEADTSGVTVTAGKPTGPGVVLTLLAGYTAPALWAWGASTLVWAGHTPALLWGSAVLVAVMLLWVRNAFGALTLATTLAAFVLVLRFGTPTVQVAAGCALTWLLAFGSLKPVVELQRQRRRGRGADSDADQLARLTGVPGICWVVLFGAVVLSAVAHVVWSVGVVLLQR